MKEMGRKGHLRRGERDIVTRTTGWEPKGSKLQSAGGAVVRIWDVVGIVLCGVTTLQEVPNEVVHYQEEVPADGGHQNSKD
jgi:hypothetical protein